MDNKQNDYYGMPCKAAVACAYKRYPWYSCFYLPTVSPINLKQKKPVTVCGY